MENNTTLNQSAINPDDVVKRGYLKEGFRAFFLDSLEKEKIAPHYHDFHKVIVFLSGDLRYVIEGKSYRMRPGDVLIIPAFEIHQPLISEKIPYKRYVLWISTEAAETIGAGKYFEKPGLIGGSREFDDVDPVVTHVIEYIQDNLAETLSVDMLCRRFFISRSSLTRRFRDITGFTPHRYICEKRINRAFLLIQDGMNANEAAEKCGFTEYSTFYRIYRKTFGQGPGKKEI